MIKAFFVDFYGTVAHEDGEVIKKITQIILIQAKLRTKERSALFGGMTFKINFLNLMENALSYSVHWRKDPLSTHWKSSDLLLMQTL